MRLGVFYEQNVAVSSVLEIQRVGLLLWNVEVLREPVVDELLPSDFFKEPREDVYIARSPCVKESDQVHYLKAFEEAPDFVEWATNEDI